MIDYWCELAWLGGPAAEAGVLISLQDDRILSIRPGCGAPPPGATVMPGLTLPGFANAHSHAFHRALRGRAQASTGSFWTWRDQMYAIAERLDPDTYHRLARATYAEMVRAGITAVGEFHYVHHQPGGRPYASPNAMGEALIAAAASAGIRLTLLDTCYLHGGLSAGGYSPRRGPQLRFGDDSSAQWAERTTQSTSSAMVRMGAAVHSVRAVDPDAIEVVAGVADENRWPVHVHLSEQIAENEQCLAALGATPTRILDDAGLISARLTAIHATHLAADDIGALGSSAASCCCCPTTERDLGDGIGPAPALAEAGSAICLGTDSHAVIDPFEECRALELDQRQVSHRRGVFDSHSLLAAGTSAGYDSIGWPEGGRLAAGGLADFITVGLDSVRMAGTGAATALPAAVFAATAADVRQVVIGGKVVVRDGAHVSIDVRAELHSSIAAVSTP